MIFLEPKGGLANRIRVIASGVWLSKISNQRLSIIWNVDSDLCCNFNSIFDENSHFEVITRKEKFQYLQHTNNPKWKKRIKAYFRNRLLGIQYCINEIDFLSRGFGDEVRLQKIAKKHKNIFISTTQGFGQWMNYLDKLPFHPNIIERVNANVLDLSSETIGMHIRRTDNIIAIENSPVELFENIIQSLKKKHTNQIFFLTTDDEHIKNRLCSSFSNVKTFRHELNRNNSEGMINATIDLLTLSKCHTIYGSYWSSYSELASLIGKCRLKVVQVESDE